MKVGIFIADSNGGYPVPASKGGAVSTLVEHLVKGNNDSQLFELDVVSVYDAEAEKLSKKYSNVTFRWIKVPTIVRYADKFVFNTIRKLFPKKKAVSYISLVSLLYVIISSSHILKNNIYDKVVLENNIPLAWAIKLANYQGKYYYHFHNVPRIDAKCKSVFEKCSGYLCVSRYVANEIMSDINPIGPISENKVKILYNCINTDQFCIVPSVSRRIIREEYGLKETDKVVCFVGRLSEEKGIDKLLEAVKLADNNIKVLIVGSLIHGEEVKDDYQKKLYALSKDISDQVIFTGYIPQNEVQKIYQCADVSVLPSMWDEPAGLTMIESLACGCPVITTNSGGIPEYMQDKAAILNRDDKLVKNICELLNSLERSEESKEDAFKYVKDNFASSNYFRRFYQCLIGN